MWYDVEFDDDGDSLRRYAIEADTPEEAEAIGRTLLTEPTARVVPLGVKPDDYEIDYDQVVPATPATSQ